LSISAHRKKEFSITFSYGTKFLILNEIIYLNNRANPCIRDAAAPVILVDNIDEIE
jgi:hypothetical protein